ncbi:unnamed protein product [Cylindrotheca closterium]|uniref:Uncharacterized protein n=1 Tax=Cylindrotheca closterium TaxID=2856 RepID=A0AAD2CGX1_9STRA|nr:unnamed protein product [Cylindrotheca closterium]
MRSVSTIFLTTLLMAVANTLAQDLPMCSSVGVYLCFDTSTDLCDEYCKNNGGGSKESCQIFDNSLRVDCKCTASDTGCLDTTYVASEIPTCREFSIFSCNNACTNLCAGLPNTRGDGQGRQAACNEPNGKTKCICDGLPVCDDAINDAPTNSPVASAPTTSSAANRGNSNPEFAIAALSLAMSIMNLIL